MSAELKVLGPNDVETVIDEIEKSFYDIPFGNTAFQTKVFILDNAITPERRYRSVGLQLLSALNMVRESVYNDKIFEITRKENLEKLNSDELSKWDKMRLELQLEKEDMGRKFSEKLMNDQIHELNLLYSEFKKLPQYTREQFENAEENYYVQSLERQVRGITGAVESLINMREDKPAMNVFLEQLENIKTLDNDILEKLRLDMPNQLANVEKREQQLAIEKSRLNKPQSFKN